MNEELALLRGIAANPYDDAFRVAYADWLDERGRPGEAAAVRRTFTRATPRPANWMLNGELIGKLLTFPLDAGVIYDACSDYCTLRPDDVTLITDEERKVVFREQQGYLSYNEEVFFPKRELTPWEREWRRNRDYPAEGEKPDFRTVVHFPGN